MIPSSILRTASRSSQQRPDEVRDLGPRVREERGWLGGPVEALRRQQVSILPTLRRLGPNGRFLGVGRSKRPATTSGNWLDPTIHVWELASGQEVATLEVAYQETNLQGLDLLAGRPAAGLRQRERRLDNRRHGWGLGPRHGPRVAAIRGPPGEGKRRRLLPGRPDGHLGQRGRHGDGLGRLRLDRPSPARRADDGRGDRSPMGRAGRPGCQGGLPRRVDAERPIGRALPPRSASVTHRLPRVSAYGVRSRCWNGSPRPRPERSSNTCRMATRPPSRPEKPDPPSPAVPALPVAGRKDIARDVSLPRSRCRRRRHGMWAGARHDLGEETEQSLAEERQRERLGASAGQDRVVGTARAFPGVDASSSPAAVGSG